MSSACAAASRARNKSAWKSLRPAWSDGLAGLSLSGTDPRVSAQPCTATAGQSPRQDQGAHAEARLTAAEGTRDLRLPDGRRERDCARLRLSKPSAGAGRRTSPRLHGGHQRPGVHPRSPFARRRQFCPGGGGPNVVLGQPVGWTSARECHSTDSRVTAGSPRGVARAGDAPRGAPRWRHPRGWRRRGAVAPLPLY
jgi:hypothetical protein